MRLRIGMLIVIVILVLGFAARRQVLVLSIALGPTPALLAPADEGTDARWVDDYYTVEKIDEQTFAIGEPRYSQQNYNYLILGSDRAILFDAGPGVRDIRPIAQTLTDLPITFVPSHFHYDHVGAELSFDRVALPDLPRLRERALDGLLKLEPMEHLGFVEGYPSRSFQVAEWLELGGSISLGDRFLRVLYTPGHTPDSISLLDDERGYLFSGDFIHPGSLFGFLPNSSMADYARGAETLIDEVPARVRVFGAHRVRAPGMPELAYDDVRDLRDTLESMRNRNIEGVGGYPTSFRVNERVELLAEPRWLQRW